MFFKDFMMFLQWVAVSNQLTRTLEVFSHAFYVNTNVLFVLLLYDTLKIVTAVAETCRCNK